MNFTKWMVGLSIAIAVAVTFSTVVVNRSGEHIAQLRGEIRQKQENIVRLKDDISRIEAELVALRDRKDVEEQMMREELGLVRKDEIIFDFTPRASH